MATKKFTVIRDDAFDSLQLEAGVILSNFDPSNPVKPQSDDIIATTTGGISVNCTATYSDYGEDVDNVPNNMMEFKQLDGWDDCSLSFSSIQFNADNTQWALGAADIEDHDTYKVVKPRRDVNLTDFKDIWWVGDKANGGAFAVKLHNALSTAGLAIQTTKNGKGTNQLTITGHVSIAAQDVMPMSFYDIKPDSSTVLHTVTQNLTNVTSDYSDPTVEEGSSLVVTLTPGSGYEIGTVTVTIGGIDATGTTWDASTGKVTIDSVTANVVITATATEV